MELCLYHPALGYYSRNAAQFGKTGDFYTSSDVHAVFGRLLARQFNEMWRVMGCPARIVVRELGPGRGLFAGDVLAWAEKKFPEFFSAVRYELVEQSPALRERIGEKLKRHVEAGRAVVKESTSGAKALSSLGAHPGTSELVPFPISLNATEVPSDQGPTSTQRRNALAQLHAGKGTSSTRAKQRAEMNRALAPEVDVSRGAASAPTILFANEFFDAFPVEIVGARGSMRIDVRDGRFVETWALASAEELEFLDRYSVHPEDGEQVEVPLAAQRAFAEAMDFERGFGVVIDYGYTRAEQLAGRHRGTMKAIRQHAVSASPYEAPGEQDITADVNFTALAAVAVECGMQVEKLVTQSQFLLGIGEANQFADAFEDCRLPQERAKVALQLKHLVTPAGMGESFQVLVASKGIDVEKVSSLAGLGFGRR